jgi:hypothetical protein
MMENSLFLPETVPAIIDEETPAERGRKIGLFWGEETRRQTVWTLNNARNPRPSPRGACSGALFRDLVAERESV